MFGTIFFPLIFPAWFIASEIHSFILPDFICTDFNSSWRHSSAFLRPLLNVINNMAYRKCGFEGYLIIQTSILPHKAFITIASNFAKLNRTQSILVWVVIFPHARNRKFTMVSVYDRSGERKKKSLVKRVGTKQVNWGQGKRRLGTEGYPLMVVTGCETQVEAEVAQVALGQ